MGPIIRWIGDRPPQFTGQLRALIIASPNSMIKELQQLSSAEADANGMRECLESCEYTVEPVLIDPTSKEVKDAVQEMQMTTQSGDHIVVFYSGHAKRIFEQESGALQLGMKDKWLLFSTITTKLQRAEAATVTV